MISNCIIRVWNTSSLGSFLTGMVQQVAPFMNLVVYFAFTGMNAQVFMSRSACNPVLLVGEAKINSKGLGPMFQLAY